MIVACCIINIYTLLTKYDLKMAGYQQGQVFCLRFYCRGQLKGKKERVNLVNKGFII